LPSCAASCSQIVFSVPICWPSKWRHVTGRATRRLIPALERTPPQTKETGTVLLRLYVKKAWHLLWGDLNVQLVISQKPVLSENWGSHNDQYEEYCLQGCDAVYLSYIVVTASEEHAFSFFGVERSHLHCTLHTEAAGPAEKFLPVCHTLRF
jgi:hypothetical protein